MEGNGVEGDVFSGEALRKCLTESVDDGSIESHRYYLSRRTVLEMLSDRGYAVPISELDLSLQEFRTIYGQNPDPERLKLSFTHKTDPSKRMLVYYYGAVQVKVSGIRLLSGVIANKESLTGLVLVLQSKITSQASKALENFSFKVERFQITDLLVNITKHVLHPKHQVLTNYEKQRLLQKYSIEEKQLPRLSMADPIARYYGFGKGQVVKVSYDGEITQSHVTYRCVW